METTPFHLTPDFVLDLGPCWESEDVHAAFGDRTSVLLSAAVADPQLSTDDAIWIGCRALWELDLPSARRFAVVVARWASVRFAERDTIETTNGPRWQGKPTPVTRVAWRHIHGNATDEELSAARDAARAAAWAARDAARDAAWAAAWAARDAACDAARAAARDAARAAARDAAWDAARAAARDAAWDAARKHLVRMIRRAEARHFDASRTHAL